MFLNVCKQAFHKSHLCISQKVKGILMWNHQHIIFIWRQRYWQIFKSALVYHWKVNQFRKKNLVRKRTQWRVEIVIQWWFEIKETWVEFERFNCCSSLTGNSPKFVVFMIISVVVLQVLYYNHLWNLKEYKHFHRRVKTGTTFM